MVLRVSQIVVEIFAVLARVVAIFVLGVLILDKLDVLVVVVAVLLLQSEPKLFRQLVDFCLVLDQILEGGAPALFDILDVVDLLKSFAEDALVWHDFVSASDL